MRAVKTNYIMMLTGTPLRILEGPTCMQCRWLHACYEMLPDTACVGDVRCPHAVYIRLRTRALFGPKHTLKQQWNRVPRIRSTRKALTLWPCDGTDVPFECLWIRAGFQLIVSTYGGVVNLLYLCGCAKDALALLPAAVFCCSGSASM